MDKKTRNKLLSINQYKRPRYRNPVNTNIYIENKSHFQLCKGIKSQSLSSALHTKCLVFKKQKKHTIQKYSINICTSSDSI